ncbi:GH3 auxin-responsive promoter family protein [uncultured Paludibaculum sp.]|uniref:GH3 auxin-responsive promoter family protein n=1 Tax=uncultured Paludibaculum sp. TaxID=1765020 RepID=UPI002AAA897A|nr:GH3 auxin-responsive promoter family protein [uncultured Paludibaculum sp.]
MNPITANSLLFVSCILDTLRWRIGAHRVTEVQKRILLRIVRLNAATAFGRDHGFARIGTVADYQAQVPVRRYGDMERYIERCAAGEPAVLTSEPITSFARSSGSTAASKLIPYTSALLREFQRGICPWLAGIFLEHPALLAGKSYWQISPAGTPATVSSGGIPVGFGEDTEYFGRRRAALVRGTLAVAEAIPPHSPMDEFRFQTLRQLLACRNLRFISVWNPSFLTLLLSDLLRLAPSLIQQIREDGQELRAVELVRLFAAHRGSDLTRTNSAGRTLPEVIWPELRLISCWTDAAARDAVGGVLALFPHIAIQGKGLIATEGLMSIPWGATGSALAITSHFLEFLEERSDGSAGAPRLAQELQVGGRYSILLTTSGGLYRYRIGDIVEVTGRIGECPVVRFCGKEGGTVDLVGEKLNGDHVACAAAEVFARHGIAPRFWMLAPQRGDGTPGYSLYVQSDSAMPPELLSAFETALETNFHYAYARRLGQLAPLRLFPIDPQSDPETAYLAFRASQGQQLGRIKRPYLEPCCGWDNVFQRANDRA